MATLTPAFRTESGKIHEEHTAILTALDALERALERLVAPPGTPAETQAVNAVCEMGRGLVRTLPEHCRHEEEKLHGPVREVSAELAEFCALMQREHEAMSAQLWKFAAAVDALETAPNDADAANRLKRQGVTFVQRLRQHIELEEHELSGFL